MFDTVADVGGRDGGNERILCEKKALSAIGNSQERDVSKLGVFGVDTRAWRYAE